MNSMNNVAILIDGGYFPNDFQRSVRESVVVKDRQ